MAIPVKGVTGVFGKESNMKIQNSSISMAATHQETSYTYKESVTMEAAKTSDAAGVILSLSHTESGRTVRESMEEYQKQQSQQQKNKLKENEARSMAEMAKMARSQATGSSFKTSDEYDLKIKLLKQILAALRGEKDVDDSNEESGKGQTDSKALDRSSLTRYQGSAFSFSSEKAVSLGVMSINGAGTAGTGTTWQRITATSGFHTEAEATTFASTGVVNTADGRQINFNVELSMSRAFMCAIDKLEVQDYIKTDPLVINLDSNIASVSDQKFYFDLDSDGDEEQISFAGKGSGFLALDKNGDGVINDGSELFGTKSGDGFKDLAAYDEDGNGWIDENDSIFSKLKVWTKDENGKDHQMDLKGADVGAIYLGNVDTQFSLKDSDYNLNAEIKKTGIYLRESTGFVGTMNHIDLAV